MTAHGVFVQGVVHPLLTEFLTHACENITFPQLLLQTVIIKCQSQCVILIQTLLSLMILKSIILDKFLTPTSESFDINQPGRRIGSGGSIYGQISETYLYPLLVHFSSLPPTAKLGQGNIFRSVCQEFCSQGGSAPLHAGIHPSPQEQTRQEQTPPAGADTPQEQTPPSRSRPPPPRHSTCWEIRTTSGRYKSYWNAILFSCSLQENLAE